VLNRTLSIAGGLNLSCSLLPKLRDIDRPEDLVIWPPKQAAKIAEPSPVRISVIIPALNEARSIAGALEPLRNNNNLEIIVVDGGSRDETAPWALKMGARVLTSISCKAVQMNIGARHAQGGILLFLHADTQLPADFQKSVTRVIRQQGVAAGAFRLGIDSPIPTLRFIENVANWRSRVLQMPYGDQAIFVSKALFQKIGGFPDIPIMEDYELIRRLRRAGKIVLADQAVRTSARRWLNLGILRTWLLNQIIIAAYHMGVPPGRLVRWYRREKGI
jgi:hypothetical protein